MMRPAIFFSFSILLSACGGNKNTQVYINKVTNRTITEVVSASGKIQPIKQIKVAPEVSGEVISLLVKEGDMVQKGQLLLTIDPDLNQTYLERAASNVKQTQANLMQGKARVSELKSRLILSTVVFERNQKLYDDKVINVSQYEQSKGEVTALKEQIIAADANVKSLEYTIQSAMSSQKEASKNLSKTRIYAPENGTIIKLNIEAGERVVGTAQMAGTELLTIADLETMEIAVTVNENDVIRLNIGDTALIDVDAFRKEQFKGIVTEISNAPNTVLGQTSLSVDQIANYDVKVTILKSSYAHLTITQTPFKTGMSATVDIITQTIPNLLSIPVNAVTTRFNDSLNVSEEIVYILDKDQAIAKVVKTGIQNDQFIEIKKGLLINNKIIEGPYKAIKEDLLNNSKVEIVTKEKFLKQEKTE